MYSGSERLVERTDGMSVGRKVAELVALGVPIAVECEYRVERHACAALKVCATRDELVDALPAAVSVMRGPAVQVAARPLKALEEAGRG